MLLSTVLVSFNEGWRFTLKSILCSFSVIIGILPLLINNYWLTGNPFKLPYMMIYSTSNYTDLAVSGLASTHTSLLSSFQSFIHTIIYWFFGIFIKPTSVISSGIFQVSPLSLFGLALILIILVHFFKKTLSSLFSKKEASIIIFASIMIFSILFAYFPTFSFLSKDFGIIPDIRYLAPAYMPFLILAFFSLKCINFNEDCIRLTLNSLVPLIIIELPLLFIILQLFWGKSLPDQLFFNMCLTYLLLLISLFVFILVLLQKTDVQNLTFPLAALMVSVLSWYLIVGFRFRILGYEGYNFWLPVIEKLWIYQAHLFPYVALVKIL
jgi:hypothetical protein